MTTKANPGQTLSPSNQNPRVGTSLLVVRNGKILVGKRKGSHAAGLYSVPGGHLDWGETFEECFLRELREECGDKIQVLIRSFGFKAFGESVGPIPYIFVTNDIMPQYGKHYITIWGVADWVDGEAENMEPEKCEGWEWIDYDQLAGLAQHEECANWIPMDLIKASRKAIGI